MINILLLYNNLINGDLFMFTTDFINFDIDNINYILDDKKIYLTFNNIHKKYDNETDIMKYIGYMIINDINNIENEIDNFFNGNNKLVYLDEIYVPINYFKLIEYSKKESLIYKLKLLKYFKLYNKLSYELMNNIYIVLLKKYYKINIKRNLLKTILLDNNI